MKKCLLMTAMLLSACSQLPQEQTDEADMPTAQAVSAAEPEAEDVVVENSSVTESKPTTLNHIFIDADMTFSGTMPCADCPGIQYHINLYRDGRFEARQEYLERNQINIVKGIWLLESRNLHLVNQQLTLPAFHFLNNRQLAMLDLSGKPISGNNKFQLTREDEFKKIDSRMAMLGLYQLNDNHATFTQCNNGESLVVANTQHHLPVMRQYQHDDRFKDKAVIATLVGRKGLDEQSNTLFIDKFEQFWPGAQCPDVHVPGKMQGIVWRAEKLADSYIPQQLNVRLIFDQNNRLYGFAGCNSFNGNYKQQANTLTVQQLSSTRKFCADSSELEQRFTQSLEGADRAEVNGDKLQLFKNNQLLLQFKPATN